MFKITKKVLSVVLSVAMLLTATIAFAEETVPNNETIQTTQTNTEAPEADAPTTETPEADAPATETPETDAPALETPEADAPAVETPEVDTTTEDTPVIIEPIKLEVTDSANSVQVNGVPVTFDDVGLKEVNIETGAITLVPVRKIAELLNCTVGWRNSDQTVHIFKNGKSVMLTINKSEIEIRDFEVGAKFVYTSEAEIKYVYADNKNVTPMIEDGRTLVPLRAISESLNTTVNYDGDAKLITINDNDTAMLTYKPSITDIKARNMIETYNYKAQYVPKTGSVSVKAWGNFAGASAELGDGIIVKLIDKSTTTANGGTCSFDDIKVGTHTVVVENVPEGYVVQDASVLTFEVKPGENTEVRIALVKAEDIEKNDESKTDENTENIEKNDKEKTGENTEEK